MVNLPVNGAQLDIMEGIDFHQKSLWRTFKKGLIHATAAIKQRCKTIKHPFLMYLLDVVMKTPGCKVWNVVVLADSLRILVKERNTTNFRHPNMPTFNLISPPA